jgi:hypothetical protein
MNREQNFYLTIERCDVSERQGLRVSIRKNAYKPQLGQILIKLHIVVPDELFEMTEFDAPTINVPLKDEMDISVRQETIK